MQLIMALLIIAGAHVEPFIAREGAFSVVLPGVPIHETLSVPTSAGPQLRHSYRLSTDDLDYWVVFACTAPLPMPKDPDQALDFARAQGRSTFGWKTVSERRIMVGDYHAREFVDEMAGVTVHGRTVLGPNGAFYSLSVGLRSSGGLKKAEEFLRSFRVLPEAVNSVCRPK